MSLLLWLLYLLFYAAGGWLVLWLLAWLDNKMTRRSRPVRIPGAKFLGVSILLLVAYFAVISIRRPPGWRSILHEEMFDACRDNSLVRARVWLWLGASPDGASDYVAGPHWVEFTSPLHVAASNGNCRLLRLLIQNGASPDIAMGDGTNALAIAVGDHKPDLVKLLLEAGANPRYSASWTAADQATSLKFADLVPIIRPYLGGG